jgi:hypothetical protein
MNFLAIVVAAIAAFIIGFLWHGPVFGKVWIKLMGMTQKDIDQAKKQSMAPRIAGAFVQQLITAYVLAIFIVGSGADAMLAVRVVFWIWLGFIATTLFNGVLWEKRSVNLYLFNIAYHLVALIAMGLILASWH